MAQYHAVATLSRARASGLPGSETLCSWTHSCSEATPHSASQGMGVEICSLGQENQNFELSQACIPWLGASR